VDNQLNTDEYWMKKAIAMARLAAKIDEVPVGAVLVKDNQVIGCGHNQVISKNDASAHAEVQTLRDAGNNIDNYRIINTTLYVTLEPCMMCIGAMIHARITRLVFGAYDSKTGLATTRDHCFDKDYHNHRVEVRGGVLETECAQLLKGFFKSKRAKNF